MQIANGRPRASEEASAAGKRVGALLVEEVDLRPAGRRRAVELGQFENYDCVAYPPAGVDAIESLASHVAVSGCRETEDLKWNRGPFALGGARHGQQHRYRQDCRDTESARRVLRSSPRIHIGYDARMSSMGANHPRAQAFP